MNAFRSGLILLALAPAWAETLPAPVEESDEGDDIASNVRRSESSADNRLFQFFDEWDEKRKDFTDRLGLSYGATYHAIGLASGLGNGVDTAASGDLTFQGVWIIGKETFDNPSELRFRLRHRHRLAGQPASTLGSDTGALWGFVDGFSDAGFEIPDCYIQHRFKRSGILLRYGQLTIDNQFDAHQLRGAKRSYLNQAFSTNPAVAFPSFGTGITMKVEKKSGFDFTIGASTVQGTENGGDVSFDFDSDEIFSAIQVGYDFQRAGDYDARLQLLGWHSDAVPEAFLTEGWGFALTYEQALAKERWQMFAKFAWAHGKATPVDLLLSGGIAGPCGDSGQLGVALGLGRGSGTNNFGAPTPSYYQGVIEAFYRWTPRDDIEISPDLQLVFGEGFNDSPGVRLVAGLRIGMVF
ncbi:carbohydrate porin [Haloferula sp.]|uniref:carbohydrate porin n=1 Tax=Haloferula sp. TaxID=2497595 RepID=UPI0032A02AB9